jgi:hypothetical protein
MWEPGSAGSDVFSRQRQPLTVEPSGVTALIATARNSNVTAYHSTSFVLVGDCHFIVESGTAERVSARRSSGATLSLATTPAAAASGSASWNPPQSSKPPIVGPVVPCLFDLAIDELAFRRSLPRVCQRSNWRYYAVLNLPLAPYIQGIVVGPFPQVWDFLCSYLKHGRYPGSRARLHRGDSVEEVIGLYQEEGPRWIAPATPWAWVVW